MAEESERDNDKGLLSRRGFLKMSGFAGGAALLGSLGTDMALASELYPSKKLTWQVGVRSVSAT